MRRLVTGVCVVLLAAPVAAGVLDDLKSSATAVRDTIGDVKDTRDEGKGAVDDAKDLATDTKKDVEKVTPKAPPPPPSAPPPPPSAAAPPPPPSATQWHIDLGNGQTRQVNQSELSGLIQSGQVRADTPVYTSAQGGWQPAGQVPALKPLFK
jgi:hypothetical protein